jgi:hypothetical protein
VFQYTDLGTLVLLGGLKLKWEATLIYLSINYQLPYNKLFQNSVNLEQNNDFFSFKNNHDFRDSFVLFLLTYTLVCMVYILMSFNVIFENMHIASTDQIQPLFPTSKNHSFIVPSTFF